MCVRTRIPIALVALTSPATYAANAPLFVPQRLGAEYTFVDQHQYPLRSPCAGPLSLLPDGDTARSHAFGVCFGVQLPWHLRFNFDVQMFRGEGPAGPPVSVGSPATT